MRDSEVLRAASDVILQGFTKDAYARNKDGMPVGVLSPDAVCFCMVGAVSKVLGGSVHAADALIDRWITPAMPTRRAPNGNEWKVTARMFNDAADRTKEQVATILQAAATNAAAAEAKQTT